MGLIKKLMDIKPADDECIKVLSEVQLFENLSLYDLEQLSLELEKRTFKADEFIFHENDESDGMYIVKEGGVTVIKFDKNNNEIPVVTLGNRNYFGEMSLIDNIKRTASIKCIKDTETYFLNRDNFFDLLKHEHQTTVRILFNLSRTLSRRLEITTRKFIEAKKCS